MTGGLGGVLGFPNFQITINHFVVLFFQKFGKFVVHGLQQTTNHTELLFCWFVVISAADFICLCSVIRFF